MERTLIIDGAVELVRAMITALVDHPEMVDITAIAAEGYTHTTIDVMTMPSDCGKVIGKQGRTARAMRTVLHGYSMKSGHNFYLVIQEVGRHVGTV
jgi:predicted RNA-binding protein YlqC (UPF0109 family)